MDALVESLVKVKNNSGNTERLNEKGEIDMQTNELMIGDLVYNAHHKCNIRLSPYDFFTHGHDIDGSQYLTTCSKPTYGRDLIPIALTLAILVKNGFVQKGPIFVLADDYYDISIHELTDSIWTVTHHNCEMSLPDQRVHISYVHELQHFLRLCGVEKEIRL